MLYSRQKNLAALALAILAACGTQDTVTDIVRPSPGKATLTVQITGLPAGASAAVKVDGPGGFSRVVAGTTTIADLLPGTYLVSAVQAETEIALYTALPASQNVELGAGMVREVTVAFALATGVLEVRVSGLPAAAAAALTVTGPNDFSKELMAASTLTKLAPGTYTIAAAPVAASGDGYVAVQPLRTIDVVASAAQLVVTVDYAIATGRLQIHTAGLPAGSSATVQIAGPNDYSRAALAEELVAGLEPGTYTLTPPNVIVGNGSYTPDVATATLLVVAGTAPAQATFSYAPYTGGLNLTIENLYITQAVQNWVGDVPLVAGRDGLIRVFVKASTSNTAQPTVRVRLFNGAAQLTTVQLTAPSPAVPTAIDDAALSSAWYGIIPAAYIQPGLKVLADVDPSNTVPEIQESDNDWPPGGVGQAFVVKSVPTFSVRLVPIQQPNSLTGNVSTANAAAFVNDIRRMYPIDAVDVDVRSPFTSSAPVVQSADNNGAWNVLLSEINALRVMDASPRYYYGVVKTTYPSGIAGVGYLGVPAAVGWDFLPSGADVMAHELGHNWGRYHAPCGGAAFTDPNFPYAGGKIGVSGFDLTTNTFKAPTLADVMGYCVPTWVSDFNYKGIMSFRETSPYDNHSVTLPRDAEPGVLIWGRISSDSMILEPAFDVVAPASVPAAGGPYSIEGRAEDGTLLFSYAFSGAIVDHGKQRDSQFAFVVPASALKGRVLSALRLSGQGRFAEQRSSTTTVQALTRQDSSSPRVRRSSSGAVVTWADASVRGVLVRDAESGEVLAIARNGMARVATRSSAVELELSDGVRSRTRRLNVQ